MLGIPGHLEMMLVWTRTLRSSHTLPSSQYYHQLGPEAGGLAGSSAQLHNEASACACLWMFTEAVTGAIVLIRDLHNSINFPNVFREPLLLFTSCFMKSAGRITALLHVAGTHTSATRLTSVPALRTVCDGVGDSSATCSANLTSLLLFSQDGRGKARKTEGA